MKKKYIKLICVMVAITINFSSMAAVVSDNDGSAFITKAEFDSLKNNFQSQLDSYNTMIDNKIDTAIANYIAGATARSTTEYTQNMGVFKTPLKIYMNLNDKSDSAIRSDWRPNQNWRVGIGYASGYVTNLINVYTNSYQPKQWYNMYNNNDGLGYILDGGYKNVNTNINYFVWGLSDTMLGWYNTAKANHSYFVAANASLSSSWNPQKYNTSNYTYNSLKIGDWKWRSDNVYAPNVNGITGVSSNDGRSSARIEKVNDTQGKINGSAWYSGWFDNIASSQSTNKTTNMIDVIPSRGDDWVHVLYDGAVLYSVSNEYIGVGAVNIYSPANNGLNEMRTFCRNVSQTDRYVSAICVPPFSIINEGYNTSTTTIDFNDWDNTSLIKAYHVTQKFKGQSANGGDLYVPIHGGFFLLTPKENGDAIIKIKVSYTGDAPYVLVNNKIIEEDEIYATDDEMKNNGFKKITGGSSTILSGNDFYKYLDNGENQIKVEGFEGGKPIFVKILFDNTSSDYVTLQSPMEISYTAKG